MGPLILLACCSRSKAMEPTQEKDRWSWSWSLGQQQTRPTYETEPCGRNNCPLLLSCFIGSGHVGISKRFPVVLALQSIVFTHFLADQISCRSYVGSVYRTPSLAFSRSFFFCSLLLADQISCRSYVGSVYRMRSLAVSHSFMNFRTVCLFRSDTLRF